MTALSICRNKYCISTVTCLNWLILRPEVCRAEVAAGGRKLVAGVVVGMVSAGDLVCMVLVGLLWGVTNPFLKAGSEGLEKIKKGNWLLQFLEEMKFLLLNYKCLIPFLLNQSGSLLYYFTLASTDLSLAVPICNSLSSVITVGTGVALGEELGGARAILGMAVSIIGITLCIIASQ